LLSHYPLGLLNADSFQTQAIAIPSRLRARSP
jgi:hypothetical protein